MRISMMMIGCLALVGGAAFVAAGCDKSAKSDAKPAAVAKGDKTEAKSGAESAKPTAPEAAPDKVAAKAPAAAPGVAPAAKGEAPAAVTSAPAAAVECGGDQAKAAEGCGTADGKGQANAEITDGKVGHYGAAFTLTDEPQAISTVLAKVEKTSDDTVKVSGKIAAVCQKKGCWFVVTDGKMKARIKMKDYGFTIPIDSKGKEAVVEGTVSVKVWEEAQVKHLEEDAGRDPKKVSGTRKEYLLTATAIDIKG